MNSIAGDSTLTVNRGTIETDHGAAIVTGSGNDQVENFGSLLRSTEGAVVTLGSGNDTFVIGGASILNREVPTYINGESGTDTLAFGVDAGTFNVTSLGPEFTYRNFEVLEKIGTADWTLTGFYDDDPALLINVRSGRLIDNAETPEAIARVFDGATLAGTGTVGALTVDSGAILAPGSGAELGTFRAASATFAAGSNFHVRVNDQGGSDRLLVNGVATINGGRVNVDVSGGYAFNTRYTILTAASIAGPRFQSAVASMALLQPVLSYDARNVYVTLERVTQEPDNPDEPGNPDEPVDPDDPPVITLDQVGRTWNQISTGRALESQGTAGAPYPGHAGGPLGPRLRNLGQPRGSRRVGRRLSRSHHGRLHPGRRDQLRHHVADRHGGRLYADELRYCGSSLVRQHRQLPCGPLRFRHLGRLRPARRRHLHPP
jgi:hypothetical protein